MKKSLTPSKLRRSCGSDDLDSSSTEDIDPVETIIGQPRAIHALQTGLGIGGKGFNIFVSGHHGTGKLTAVKDFLGEIAHKEENPGDIVYVNNFKDSYNPRYLAFPEEGSGRTFHKDMEDLLEEIGQALKRAFESEEFANEQKELFEELQQQRNELFSDINERARNEGMIIKSTSSGIYTVPIKDGEEMSDDDFNALPKDEREKIANKRDRFNEEIRKTLKHSREIERETNEKLQRLERKTAEFAINPLFEELREKYSKLEKVIDHLKELESHILENLQDFTEQHQQKQNKPLQEQLGQEQEEDPKKYEVNSFIDNSERKGAPVLIEQNPSYNNLFGKIEKESQYGALITNFTLIRPGSLHKANGGYLVIPAREILMNPFSWDALKRALRNSRIDIEEAEERFGFMSTKTLKPEPVPLNVKVILIDDQQLYSLLYEYDTDFRKLFKIRADFDTEMERNQKNLNNFLGFIGKVCQEEGFLPFEKSGISRMVEHSSRIAGDKHRLSTHFGDISDIMREADHYAKQEKAKKVASRHVKQAIENSHYRSNLIQVKLDELIQEGTIDIDVKGEEVGQVNGLAVLDTGDISFGKPSRITVSTAMGSSGFVDVERKAELGGPIHTKGMEIIQGYLESSFAQDHAISLTARTVFEQSYSGIDGDSASSTELYAILSSLAAVPIQQGIAVTGSVNQKGEVQAIGGVNQKIEGYFEVCRMKGLTGEQGVLIPNTNVKNLMLREEVIEAVKNGEFNIWSVGHIDEGIELLTGVKAGKKLKKGGFSKDSIKDKVDRRLKEMNERSKGNKNGKK
ncbi:MAG: Lon protease family protein [Flavobacteriales bacterium]